MGELTNGPNGSLRGKVGNLVYYTLRGKTVVRTVPRKRGKKRTAKERGNTTGFSQLQKWMSPIGEFVKYGFKDYGTSDVGYRSAISYALNNGAIQGNYPNQVLDPSKIKVTGGELQAPAVANAILEEGNIIRFKWDRGDINDTDKNDQAMLLVYSPPTPNSSESVVYKLTGAFRGEGTDTLHVGVKRHDREFHFYLGFVNAHRTQQSHSQYLGAVIIPGMGQEELFKVRIAAKKAKADEKKQSELTVEDRTLDIARNLRNMGLTDQDVASATGLSLEAISKL